jgi:hypothetical protein
MPTLTSHLEMDQQNVFAAELIHAHELSDEASIVTVSVQSSEQSRRIACRYISSSDLIDRIRSRFHQLEILVHIVRQSLITGIGGLCQSILREEEETKNVANQDNHDASFTFDS